MIRGLLLFLIFYTATVIAAAQEASTASDSLDLPKWHEKVDWSDIGISLQISRQLAPTPPGRQLGGWVSSGLAIKRWQGGVFISTYEEDYREIIIFPNEFEMNYLYGGYFLSYRFIQNRWFQSNLTAAYGRGDVLWERSTTFENYYRDAFSMYHLMLDLEATPIRFIRPIAQLGYRKMSPISMPLISASDFSGLSIIFGVRIGFYTKRTSR